MSSEGAVGSVSPSMHMDMVEIREFLGEDGSLSSSEVVNLSEETGKLGTSDEQKLDEVLGKLQTTVVGNPDPLAGLDVRFLNSLIDLNIYIYIYIYKCN